MKLYNLDVLNCEAIQTKEKDGFKYELQASERKFQVRASLVTLSKDEIHNLCVFLKQLKTPDGYASNISRCVQVEQLKIFGLKTHDYHILLHQLLPVALRHADKKLANTLISFCGLFKTVLLEGDRCRRV